jgi:hypothetical protein
MFFLFVPGVTISSLIMFVTYFDLYKIPTQKYVSFNYNENVIFPAGVVGVGGGGGGGRRH